MRWHHDTIRTATHTPLARANKFMPMVCNNGKIDSTNNPTVHQRHTSETNGCKNDGFFVVSLYRKKDCDIDGTDDDRLMFSVLCVFLQRSTPNNKSPKKHSHLSFANRIKFASNRMSRLRQRFYHARVQSERR